MSEINVLALEKDDGEVYVLLFPDARAGEALRVLGRWAAHPQLSFTWYDAAALSQRVRAMAAGPRRWFTDL